MTSKTPATSALADYDVEIIVKPASASKGVFGNTKGGQYHVTCTPDIVNIAGKGPAKVTYKIPVGDPYIFTGAVASDYLNQLSIPVISEDGKTLTLVHINRKQCLISVALQFKSSSVSGDQAQIFAFDPQMLNTPE